MTLTNKNGLPHGFVAACSTEQHNKAGELSATTLLKGVKEIILTRRYWNDIEDDVSNRVWAVFGTAVHALLEKEGDSEFTEETLRTKIDGVSVSGTIDNYNMETGTITDYKTASVWKVQFRDFSDWRKQGLTYAWLLRKNGFPAEKCQFVALLKDHSKTQARRNPEYPQNPVYIYEFDVTDKDIAETEIRIKEKIAEFNSCLFLEEEDIPDCTKEERWAKDDTWAVMKKGRKSAVRVFPSEAEAEAMAETLGAGHYVEFRQGVSTKCLDYCPARAFCDFAQKLQKQEADE